MSGVKKSLSVDQHMLPFASFMADDAITEVCVNRPKEIWCERRSVWERHDAPEITFEHMESLATATAKFASGATYSDEEPILSAILPGDQRVQFVRPPACENGTLSMTIRKPSFTVRSLEDYRQEGFFDHVRKVTAKSLAADLSPEEQALVALKEAGDYVGFLRKAIKHQKVIVVAGETGSGKTTFMKSLMQEIPTDQRIITIEDTPELFLPNHPNRVHLFYPSEASEEQGSPLTSAKCLKATLRMKPTRILLAELRGGECFDFVRVAASGHGGSITSLHAGSCSLAFEQMALMVLQNRQGRMLPYEVIRRMLYLVVDVIVHVNNDVYDGLGRHITELWYDPLAKRSLSMAA